jgi:hypothetical protein
VLRSALGASGGVTVSGSSGDAIFLEVRVSGTNEMLVPVFVGADHAITAESTLTDIAIALAAWLNADEHFRAFYSAAADEGTPGKVLITDERGVGGVLEVDSAGGPAITAEGFAGPLGIRWGRRYACAYSGDRYVTELSPLSVSSGPTGDATRVEIRDVPRSSDQRVDEVWIYAAPDGQEGPSYRVGVVANGVSEAVDTTAEEDLAGQPVYPGPTQPESDGAVIVTVKKDGHAWFKLYCAPGQMRSEPVHGFALDAIETDAEITADIDNRAGAIDLQVFLQ